MLFTEAAHVYRRGRSDLDNWIVSICSMSEKNGPRNSYILVFMSRKRNGPEI